MSLQNRDHRSLFRILNEVHDKPWIITSRALENICSLLERPAADLDGVAARLGRPLENTGNRVEMRDGVAILSIEGPLFRYANLFTEISGATSVQQLSTDFQAALDDRSVKQILLNVNSEGGQVDGINELADMIRLGASAKPVMAYVDGMAASAGYWLASAAPRIAINESGLAGSIGVVASITDNRAAQERQGVKRYEIVSSLSPYKRPDVSTEAGRAQILEVVDALAELFVGRVAAFRGVTADAVAANFGQGKMLSARRALAAGMVDEITSFEPLVARLAAGSSPRAVSISLKENPMADNPAQPAATATQAAPAATTTTAPAPPAVTTTAVTVGTVTSGTVTVVPMANDRQRIAAILTCEEAQGRDQLARTLALETDHDVETVRRILKSAPAASAAAPAATSFQAEMGRLKNPQVGVKGDEGADTAASEAQAVLRFVPKARRVQAN